MGGINCHWRHVLQSDLVNEIPDDAASWLHADEWREYVFWRNPVRRASWVASRWVGKQLLAELGHGDASQPQRTAILSRDRSYGGMAPVVLIDGQQLPVSLSISHAGDHLMAAVAEGSDARVGVDITPAMRYKPSFLNTWFTEAERRWIENSEWETGSVVWAAKEAAFKATSDGARFLPQLFEAAPANGELAISHLKQPGESGTANSPGRLTAAAWRINGQVAVLATGTHVETAPNGPSKKMAVPVEYAGGRPECS